MKRILSYLFMSIITIGIQAQQVVVERTDGTKGTYPVETFQNATFISNATSQDCMIVKTTSGDKTEIPVNKVKSIIVVDKYNGHEYVDLGLPSGLKWATMNVGASKPEEYGDYFAWGETSPKTIYDWSTYTLCKGSYDTMTKYCTSSSYGTVDNKTTLEPADDAAYENWGGSWRMPTTAEQDELREKCTWTWTTQGKVKGYKVTGPSGDSIFLPAAGYRYDGGLNNVSSSGGFWSSSLDSYDSYDAFDLFFGSDGVYWGNGGRFYGRSVRAVCP